MADTEQYVYMQGTIEVNGKVYLPGEPFSMSLKAARHNAKNGVRLLPASAVSDSQIAAARANLQILVRPNSKAKPADVLDVLAEEVQHRTEKK